MVTQPPSPKMGRNPLPIFGPFLLSPNGWMHQDATCYGGRPRRTRHCVRCGPTTPIKRAHPPHPIFGPCVLWPNGWMDEDAAWYGSRPRPSPHCTRPGPSSRERGTAAPLFSAHVYCGHGRPSQLLLSSCSNFHLIWCADRPPPDMRTSMISTQSKIKVKVTGL